MNTPATPAIDFSMFPASKKTTSALRNLAMAILTTCGLAVLPGLTIILTNGTTYQETAISVVVGAILLGLFLGLPLYFIVYAVIKDHARPKQLQVFAEKNGWQYDGTIRPFANSEFTDQPIELDKRWVILFTIRGSVQGRHFTFYQLREERSRFRQLIDNLSAGEGYYRGLTHITILKVAGNIPPLADSTLLTRQETATHTYFVAIWNLPGIDVREVFRVFSEQQL